MSLESLSIILVDVGIQNISVARDTLLSAYDLGKGQIAEYTRPGVPQLYGSVYSIIRCGYNISGAYLREGGADITIGFEMIETFRACIGDRAIALPALLHHKKLT